jgi:hypothetical protein
LQKKSLALLGQVQNILNSYDFALTLRQIYYQLVAKQIIPNEQGYYKKLSYLCVEGRNEGILSEEAFDDRLRELDIRSTWTDISDFFNTVLYSYHKDKWQDQNDYIEIWTEKDALRSVLSEITDKYDVGLMVCRGHLSRTEIYRTSERFKNKSDKNCFIYYCGDFDPSGLSIYESIKERINNFGVDINFKRIALTPEQIEKYNLPSDPAKQSDSNYKKFVEIYGDNVVELDSLPPEVLRKLIENYIEKHVDYELLGQVRKIEQEEKEKIVKIIEKGES